MIVDGHEDHLEHFWDIVGVGGWWLPAVSLETKYTEVICTGGNFFFKFLRFMRFWAFQIFDLDFFGLGLNLDQH